MSDEQGNDKPIGTVELEFEVGDLELEIKGPADVVERIFKVLIDKLEIAKIEITPKEEFDEFEYEGEEGEETPFELHQREEESSLTEEPESSTDSFERTPSFEPTRQSDDFDEPGSDKPPSWDDLDFERP